MRGPGRTRRRERGAREGGEREKQGNAERERAGGEREERAGGTRGQDEGGSKETSRIQDKPEQNATSCDQTRPSRGRKYSVTFCPRHATYQTMHNCKSASDHPGLLHQPASFVLPKLINLRKTRKTVWSVLCGGPVQVAPDATELVTLVLHPLFSFFVNFSGISIATRN